MIILIFKYITLDNFHYKIGYFGLFIVFVFNTVYFPNFLFEFFTKNSDKFQFLNPDKLRKDFYKVFRIELLY